MFRFILTSSSCYYCFCLSKRHKIKRRFLYICLFDHEQSRGYYKHSNHLQTTKTNNKLTRQSNLVFNIMQNDIQYFPSFIKQTC